MENDNILAVNVPNMITITIMALIGGFILGMIKKAVASKTNNSSMMGGS